jgi:DNA polymerase-3 subunit gamma/tau
LAPDPRTGFRMTLIRMLAFRPEATAQAAAVTTRSAPSPSVPRVSSAGGDKPMAEGEWSNVLAGLDLDGPTRMLALNCVLVARTPGLLKLTLDPRNAGARTRAREEKLAQALSRHFGESLHLEIATGVAGAETPAQAGERASQEALQAARDAFSAEPTVQALQQRFGATMNPDSVRPRKPT